MSEDHFLSPSTEKNPVDTAEDQENNQEGASPCIIEHGVTFTLPTNSQRVARSNIPFKTQKSSSRSAMKRVPKARPNHFFAVQISNPQILEAVGETQAMIVEKNDGLKTAIVSPATLHITLAVANLRTSEEIAIANQILEKSVKTISSQLKNPHFEVHVAQLGHFNKKVIYARVQEDNDGIHYLTTIWEFLCNECRTAGILLIDSDKFHPHITLLKLSKDPSLYRKGIKAVPPDLYESHVERKFGRQVIESVQLLSMTDSKDETGYYALKGEFRFSV